MKYNVTVVYDASFTYQVDASTPEEAASKAYDLADARLCHQCSDTLELGDPIKAIVYDKDGVTELYDDGDIPTHKAAERAAAPDSDLHVLMERNAWRAAMIGLCQPKYEKDVATPDLAAEHLRERLRRTAAPQPPEGARVVDGKDGA